MSEAYISVGQLNNYIKSIFDAEVMLQNICVFGEVSSYNISNGIAYFNLKDENGLLQCVLFDAKRFDTPKLGDMVLVRGSMSYYSKGGKLSFNAYSIAPYGRGILYEKFLELKDKLEKLGYFDESIKKPIPDKVKRIGVVTSETGAVIRDIINVTHRRNDSIDIVLYPVKVQGVGADVEIANGIKFFSKYPNVDVVIVARGGGSLEDLEPFNSEIVANAVFKCSKPLVSAVGHETDFTIIDFVSDRRASTPSVAAEIVAWDKNLEIEKINSILWTMTKNIDNKTLIYSKDIDILYEKIDNISSNNLNKCINLVNIELNKFDIINNIIEDKSAILGNYDLILNKCNPIKLSQMGYSKLIQNGRVVSSTKDVSQGDIELSMIDGNIKAKIIGWEYGFWK